MAQQNINIGTAANDGTGDPARTAFNKVNQNFTEAYASAAAAAAAAATAQSAAGAAQATADGSGAAAATAQSSADAAAALAAVFAASDVAALEVAHPAASNPGRRANVGVGAQKSQYISDGVEWVPIVTAHVNLTGAITEILNLDGSAALTIQQPSGNVLANIIPRHDTLANLLTTQGGQYEIGIATDADVLVKFSGAAGGAGNVALSSDSFLGIATATRTAAQSIATTATQIDLTAVITDDLSAVDLTGNVINIPANATRVQIGAYGVFAAGAGALRELRVLIGALQIQQSTPASATATTKLSLTTEMIDLADNAIVPGADIIRLNAYQDSGGALNISNARLSVSFYN